MKHVHGGDVYSNSKILDFSANINPMGMPKAVLEAAKYGIEKAECYPDINCSRLRREIAHRYHMENQWILCGNGAAELIYAICYAMKPKKALLIAPTFAEYEEALKLVEADIVHYVLKEETNFILTKDYESFLTEDIDIIFICNPNNPTGQMIPKERLLSLVKICEEKNILMVLDECFIDFSTRLSDNTMRGEVGKYKNLIILNAFTKLFAIPGLRLGYIMCQDVQRLGRIQRAMQPWNVSIPSQLAGIAAIREHEYIRKTRCMLATEKEYLLKELAKEVKRYEDGSNDAVIKIYGYEANFIFFRGNKDLYQRLLIQNIQIRDCSNFYGLEKGYYRICVRDREDNEVLIKAIHECDMRMQVNLREEVNG